MLELLIDIDIDTFFFLWEDQPKLLEEHRYPRWKLSVLFPMTLKAPQLSVLVQLPLERRKDKEQGLNSKVFRSWNP